VTPRDCAAPLVTVFTVTPDGGLIQTASSHPTQSPLHGTWVQIGERKFAFACLAHGFDTDGHFVQTMRVRGQYVVADSGGDLTGRSVLDLYDLSDVLFRTVSTTTSASRIKVEPLA
jgi:hypothetical protein